MGFVNIRNISPRFKKYLIIFVLLLIFLFVVFKVFSGRNKVKGTLTSASSPIQMETLNKEFSFPVSGADGKSINMKFVVQDASLNNEIVVQGQNATAIPGRVFLIISLRISNDFNQSIQINTRDYVRLSVNGDGNTWLAPDIHNDPVEVQAISTKITRVGFAINTTDKNLVLQIGEIKGDKQKIELKF